MPAGNAKVLVFGAAAVTLWSSCGERGCKKKEASSDSHGGKPSSKVGKGFPRNEPEERLAGKVDNIAGKPFNRRESGEVGK